MLYTDTDVLFSRDVDYAHLATIPLPTFAAGTEVFSPALNTGVMLINATAWLEHYHAMVAFGRQRNFKFLSYDQTWVHGYFSRVAVLKDEARKGFHPTLPPYGFGDPTSYSIVRSIVRQVRRSGAVRHGAECFNFYFPQELDAEFLVVWDGLDSPPWKAVKEPELREFLLARVKEGYSFPINPVWPIRDPGWIDILYALQQNPPPAALLGSAGQAHDGHDETLPLSSAAEAPSAAECGEVTSHQDSSPTGSGRGARGWSKNARRLTARRVVLRRTVLDATSYQDYR